MIRKKQIKRMAGCVMAVTMALTGVPVTAGIENINVEVVYADETLTYTEGNSTYTYTELSDGTLEISDYEGTDTEIVIPGEIDGKKVTSIGDYTFSECIRLISIEIPKGIISIGEFAFVNCSNLARIEISESVMSINDKTFVGCFYLEEIEVDINNLNYKSVEGVLFNKELTEIIRYPSGKKDTVYKIPESVTEIASNAFSECGSLTRIEISESVTSIGSGAFEYCYNLAEIEIPEGITSIPSNAFSECRSLTKVKIPESVTNIGNSAFYECRSLTRIEIPENVTCIGSYAFARCRSLKEITIPESVSSIDGYVFNECNSLERIEVDINNLNYKSIEGVLINKELNEVICYPSGKKNTVYMVPEGVTSIGTNAFNECISLTRIEMSESVTSIGYCAFFGCSSLKEISIPASVKNIGVYAFGECSSLKKISIPASVTSIGGGAFWGCSSLEEIIVDNNNLNYSSVEGVLFNKELTEINCYPLGKKGEVYIVPKSVTSIGYGVFYECSSLTRIEIPEGVTSIDYFSFGKCSNLTKIEIPKSVTNIQFSSFDECRSLIIYGEKDSYAETYAKGENIPFIAIDKIISSDNITVIYPIESIKGTVSLQTKKLSQEDEEYKNIKFEDKIIDSSVAIEDVIFTAYDISIIDENNNKVQPSQSVTVKIPYIEGYDKEKSKVYRVNDDGTFTDMNAMYENGYFVFETSHFSTYIITETELLTTLDIISGDVNGDGTLDIKDSALLKRYLAGWEVEIDAEAADVDSDGKVTIKDSALVKRQLAGWE